MAQKYDVFISYRRVGGDKYARNIQLELEKKYKVFLDFDELKDGVFDQRIMDAIREAPIFLLVLSRGALDRCVNEEDWVRKEIFYAVECNRHIVPVVIVDDNFEGIPDCLPEGLKKAVGAHQFSELQMKTLFKASMDELVRYRIAPFVQKQEEQSGAEIHIETDVPCSLFRFNTFVKDLQPDADNVVRMNPGTYKLTFRSTQFSDIEITKKYTLATGVYSDLIEVALKEKVEAKIEANRKAEEEARQRKAAEEAKCKAKEWFALGYDYYFGKNGKSKDYTEAVKWYRKAAEQGDADAQYSLGHCYLFCKGVAQDYTEAVRWYRKAAEQGHAYAQFYLGLCYYSGKGVNQDYAEAIKWYRKAAEQGNDFAQCNLGICYYNGQGVNKDLTKAKEWLLKAAENGSEVAKQYLKEYFGV